jgi:CheY-like chemotaxis protein
LKRILVIDDEVIVTRVLARLLARSSYKVTVALDGQEGIRLYREEPADLVIVDIFMPGVDGLEVIRTLRAEFSNARFIAISGGPSRGQPNLLPRARELGAQYAFEKPIDNEALLQAIEKLLDFQE